MNQMIMTDANFKHFLSNEVFERFKITNRVHKVECVFIDLDQFKRLVSLPSHQLKFDVEKDAYFFDEIPIYSVSSIDDFLKVCLVPV